MFIEIIAHTLEDVEAINNSMADRIELCGAMQADGLTPKIELIKAAASISKLPIRVMIRNHNNGFYYTEAEFTKMLEQIKECNQIDNIDGYVIGCLNQGQTAIDVEQIKKIKAISNGRKLTFHKACESLINPQLLNELVELGIDTVLTQGGTKPITENIDILNTLINEKADIQILLGGGVNLNNYQELAQISPNLHLGSAVREQASYDKPINIELINQLKMEKEN